MKHRQLEGTEPNNGTVRDRKRRVQPTPGERSTDRNLGALYQPQCGPHLVLRGRNTREEGTGMRAPRRRRPSKGARNEKTMRGPGLAVERQSTFREIVKEEWNMREKWPWSRPPSARTGRMGRSQRWRGGHPAKSGERLKRRKTQWWRWSANGRPYSDTAAARREREKKPGVGNTYPT